MTLQIFFKNIFQTKDSLDMDLLLFLLSKSCSISSLNIWIVFLFLHSTINSQKSIFIYLFIKLLQIGHVLQGYISSLECRSGVQLMESRT